MGRGESLSICILACPCQYATRFADKGNMLITYDVEVKLIETVVNLTK